jgi:hypothetical protein
VYKTCLICTHSFSGSSYFEFLLSTFVLASLFMSSFFSPFLLLLLYHFPHLTVLTVAVSRASLSIPRPPSFATPHTPLAARLRAPKLTTLAYDRSAPQLLLSKLTSKAVRDSRHIASSGCWHSCGGWGLVLNLVVPLPPTKWTLCMTDVLSGTSHKYSGGVKLVAVKDVTGSGHSVALVWSKCVCEHRRAENARQPR